MLGACALIYVPFTLPDRIDGSGSLLAIVMLIRIVLFIVFPTGGEQISRSQPLTVASTLWLWIKTPPRSLEQVWLPGGCSGVTVAVTDVVPLSVLPVTLGLSAPLSFPMKPWSQSQMKSNMCTTQPAFLWIRFTSWIERWEIKYERKRLNLKLTWKGC